MQPFRMQGGECAEQLGQGVSHAFSMKCVFCLYCIAKLVREIVCMCLTLIGTASSQPGPLRLKEFS